MQCSVFEVPRLYVKGRRSEGYLVCNSVAQAVVDKAAGGTTSSCSSGGASA